jgi:hypothetical protein
MAMLRMYVRKKGRAMPRTKTRMRAGWTSDVSGHYIVGLPLEGTDIAAALRRARLEPLIESAGADIERNAVDRRAAIAEWDGVPDAAVKTGRTEAR